MLNAIYLTRYLICLQGLTLKALFYFLALYSLIIRYA